MTDTPTALLVILGLIGSGGLGYVLKTWLDYLRAKRKGTDDMSLSVVAAFQARLEKVEGELEKERERAKQDRKICDAEMRVLRHRVNNGASMIDALLLLHEMPAAKAKAQVAAIREQWGDLRKISAAEGAIVMTAPIATPAE